MIRVLIADDQALLRGSLRLLVENGHGMEVVGEAGTGAETVELTRARTPDVVLMDIRMPEMDGIEATRWIAADPALTGSRILILTTFDLDEYVYAGLRAGAAGFLLKDTPPDQLLHAIRVVANGEELLAPSVTRRLVDAFVRRDPLGQGEDAARPRLRTPTGRLVVVTEREREVLVLVARGFSNQEIGRRLYLSMATVKTHIGRLLAKLDARDRTQLVIVAYESGLVVPGD